LGDKLKKDKTENWKLAANRELSYAHQPVSRFPGFEGREAIFDRSEIFEKHYRDYFVKRSPRLISQPLKTSLESIIREIG